MSLFIFGGFAAAILVAVILLRDRLSGRGRRHAGRQPEPKGIEAIRSLLDKLSLLVQTSTHPNDLLNSADFHECVRAWSTQKYTDDDLLEYARSDNQLAACVALEALRDREIDENSVFRLVAELGKLGKWPTYFTLRAILDASDKPLIGAVIAQVQEVWLEDDQGVQFIQYFVDGRLKAGETPTFGKLLQDLPSPRLVLMRRLLSRLESSRVSGLVRELDGILQSSLNLNFLNTIGRVWSAKDLQEKIIVHEELKAAVDTVRDLLMREPRRSVLLVGEPGTGKTTVVRALALELAGEGWSIFESRASDVIAGQIFIGQSEQRVRDLMKNISLERKVIWFIPNLHEMQYAGRTYWSPISVLDMILPFVEEGKILVIGELGPSAYGQLLKENKRSRTAFTAVRIQPLNERDTLALARHRIAELSGEAGGSAVDEERTSKEALNLARQYLTGRETPGNVLDLLSAACRKAAEHPGGAVSPDHLLAALSDSTGLPMAILDERVVLSVEELRDHFQRRILGQEEAVNCLVERIAMVKAGLCDPSRPYGVFLFVGPTGTGKTEVAKTLATFLFGSPDRLIRQDMSEYQASESVSKILGDRAGLHDEGSLVGKIRNQPFSVVLLDEFEKANPHIWDLFLQVFDEGRLTDAQGNVADFRHCIFILTSNLGTTIGSGMGIGFMSVSYAFSTAAVQKAIQGALRPELLNRIDRVVIFRPLDRNVMRSILQNELDRALQRRGLRTRQWVVEWEDSALEFLLSQGFTPELGARPLKRVIDRYLLSPLAITLVEHQAPQGDQFLFVRSDGNRILVEFIDPSGETAAEPPAAVGEEEAEIPQDVASLRRLMLHPAGDEQEVRALRRAYEGLSARIESEDWRSRKENALRNLEDPGFWSSETRFAVLGTFEYQERIHTGLQTALSLIRRFTVSGAKGKPVVHSTRLISRLSLQLYLLQEACDSLERSAPKDAFLRIEAVAKPGVEAGVLLDFAERLCRMYLQWAGKRNMRFKLLQDERLGSARRFLLAVSGFGAYSILAAESGLHVFEVPEKEKGYTRYSVQVEVIAQPDAPPLGAETLQQQALRGFLEVREPERRIVRNYREAPSPLVRDAVSRWRSGRLDQVLEGNFDLFGRALRCDGNE